MPIRLTCPSCSAALSVKDEYAGRAVKCPKCGGVIPAGQPAAAPPPSKPSAALPPPPAPERPLFEDMTNEPAGPSEPKVKGQPSRPAAKADELPDDDAPPRPARSKRPRDEDDAEDRPTRRRKRDDNEDDRPARGRKRDDDDRPPKKSKTPLILGIVGFLMLTCCGSVGFGIYWFVSKARDVVEQVKVDLEKADFRVSRTNYDQLKVGTTTRAEVEQILGTGKTATDADPSTVFPANAQVLPKWKALAAKGRVLMWRNGDDRLIAAFYPDADGKARLQGKAWRPKSGATLTEGQLDDAKFVKEHPADGRPLVTVNTKVPVEDLVSDFKANPAAAAARYNDKVFLVSGTLSDIKVTADGMDVVVTLEGADGARVSCDMVSYHQYTPFNHDRGQRLEFEGRCFGLTGGVVTLKFCANKEAGKSLAEKVSAQQLLAAYHTATAGDAKYKDKWVEVDGQVAKMMPDGTLFLVPQATGSGSKPPDTKIRLDYDPSYQVLLTKLKLKVGDRVRVKGLCKGMDNEEIAITDGWVSLSYHIQNN